MSVHLRAMVALVLFGFVFSLCSSLHAQGVDPFGPADPFAPADPFGGGGPDPFGAGGDDPFGGPAPPRGDDPFGGDPFGGPADADPFGDPFGDPAAPPATKPKPAEKVVVKVAARRAEGKQGDSEERIWDQLDKPTTMEFIETPLSDVVDFLADLHGINVRIDTRALEDVGLGNDTPITRSLRRVSLRSALRLALEEMDLTFIVRDGVLLITTPDEAESESHLITKVYGVKRLLRSGDPLVDEDPWAGDDIIDLVVSTIRPTTWEDVGGAGSVELLRNSLIVSNTMEAHEDVAELLDTLEQVRKAVAESKTKPPKVTSFPQQPAWKQRIQKALAESVDCDFHETPLADVADFLAAQTKVDILIDHRALDDVGIGSDSPITFNVKGISMAAALRRMLKEMDLHFVIRHEVLLITTPEEAESALETRIFPVADLVLPLEGDSEWLTLGPWESAADYDSLIDLIIATVRPTTWEEVGGPGPVDPWPAGYSLVIAQTHEVFQDIEHLLAGLRDLRAKLRNNPRRIITEATRLDEIDTPQLAKLREALTLEVGMLSFRETPLEEVMAFIGEKHGVPIMIDHRAMEDVGIADDTPITATLGGESLGQALRRIMREMDCTYVVRDEVILITTPEEAESELITRIYPVGDLVLAASDDLTGGLGDADFDSLIDVVVATVRPDTWEEVGGAGAVEPYSPVLGLVVSQTEEVHEAVADLLAQIRTVEAAAKVAEDQAEEAAKPPAAVDEVLKNKQGQRLHLKVYRLAKQEREHSGELAEVIRELVAPKSWDADDKHYLRPLTGSIIVRQTAETHRTIHRLLSELDVLQWPQFGGGGSAFGVDDGTGFGPGAPAGGVNQGGFFSVPDHIQGQFGGGFATGSLGPAMGSGPPPVYVRAIRCLSLPAAEDRPAMQLRIYHQGHREAGEIAETISELIEPDSWQIDGAYLRAFDGKLIVRHEADVHRKIYRLLIELGAIERPLWPTQRPSYSVVPVVGELSQP